MASRYNTAQANVVDQDNRNMATGAQGVQPMSQEIDSIWAAIDSGAIGIQSAAPDIDALCLGGGAFTYNPSGSSGLTFAYNAGRYHNGTQLVNVSAGTIALAASAVNYIELDRALGIQSNTVGFTSGRYPLMMATTSTNAITAVANGRTLIVLLGPQSVSGTLLSAPAATKSVDKSLGSLSATTAFTVLAPCTGKVSAVTFCCAAAAAASDTNYWSFGIVNKTTGAGTNAVLDTGADNTTKATGGSAIAAYDARSLALNATSSNGNVTLNDVLEITITMTGAPTTLTESSLRIDFTFTN